jgi:hypothetical protein
MSRCGYIIPPNLYPKTCPEKEVDTPTKKQSSATHCCKSDGGNRGKDGEKGKSDILSRVRSIAQGGAIVHTRALARAWDGRDRTPLAHGERANDRPMRCNRSLPQ